jgi:hypothetical protein
MEPCHVFTHPPPTLIMGIIFKKCNSHLILFNLKEIDALE